MTFIESVFEILAAHPKRIVFPEGAEPRTIQAAAEFARRKLGVPILLGDRAKIEKAAERVGVALHQEKIRVIDPAASSELPSFCERLEQLDRYKGFGVSDSRQVMVNPNYFGAMMIQYGLADGLVGGAGEYSSGLLRPLLRILKPLPDVQTVFGCLIMELPDRAVGDDGVLFFADGAVIPEPSVEQLATIAVHTGELYARLRQKRARVALLSFSTKGSSTRPSAQRVAAAAALARQKVEQRPVGARAAEIEIDGELQADTAIDARLASRKAPGSLVAGQANVLIFPDLNSGNIAQKLVQYLANGNSYGQILLGLSKPAADMSRGATAESILGVAAIVGLQAIEYHTIYR
jgi:phosphate acetyltransferase